MKPANILELARNRRSPDEVLGGLLADNQQDSLRAGQSLVAAAKKCNLSLRDYLRLAVDPNQGEFAGAELNGYEASLAYLGLPVKDDFDAGIVLQAAGETFQYKPGTRALFPEVANDYVAWTYRQENIETVEPMLSNTRNVNGVELITTVVNDSEDSYNHVGAIAEGARIPINAITASQRSVTFYKFGGGYRTTYEFERRVGLDIITPYANRIERKIEQGQVKAATNILLNGDGVNPAAGTTNASDLAATFAGNGYAAAGQINWEIFLKWLVSRAQAGVPVDTVIGDYALYFEWLRMFSAPTVNAGMSQSEILQKAGVQTAIANPRFNFNVNFVLSSSMTANKLLGFTRGETLERLIENGSDIEESAKAVENQTVTYVKTLNSGFAIRLGDTRNVLNLDEVAADPQS